HGRWRRLRDGRRQPGLRGDRHEGRPDQGRPRAGRSGSLMKRVVVTGLGIVSPIGNNAAEVTQSLKEGKSGIEFVPQYKELGFRSQVAGTLKLDVEELVDRRLMRFMGNGGAYA